MSPHHLKREITNISRKLTSHVEIIEEENDELDITPKN
jgi:hypothetical protein